MTTRAGFMRTLREMQRVCDNEARRARDRRKPTPWVLKAWARAGRLYAEALAHLDRREECLRRARAQKPRHRPARLTMNEDDEIDDDGAEACVTYFAEGAHDGPGWYWFDDNYPDEGACGAFATAAEAEAHARASDYTVIRVQS